MQGWSKAAQLRTISIFTVVVFPLAVWLACRMGTMFIQADAPYYLGMAAGKPAMMPFASRQLGPLLARALDHLLHVGVREGFVVPGVISVLVLIVTTAWLLVRSGAPRWTLYLLGGLMFWGFEFHALVMPDLLYAALLCVFLLLLREKQTMAACLMMFPLMLSRESTLLTLVCFLVAGWRRLKLREVVAALASAGAAMVVVKRLTMDALPNLEHISPTLYLVAKMPWNFMRNVLGIRMWANLYPACPVPIWQSAVHFGPLKAVGICGYFPAAQAETFGLAMATFGLLPILAWVLRKQMVKSWSAGDLMLRFALVYGVLSYLMSPLLGESMLRLYAFGWPLFLIALPVLLGVSRANFTSAWAAVAFVALHLFVTWSLAWAFPSPMFEVTAVGWILGAILLRATFRVQDKGQLESA